MQKGQVGWEDEEDGMRRRLFVVAAVSAEATIVWFFAVLAPAGDALGRFAT